MFKKSAGTEAGAGKVIHDLSQALMHGSVGTTRVPRETRDSVREVIEAFNRFVAAGEDPYKFAGFARMRFSDADIEAAEPLVRSMLRRGFGAAYIEAGVIACDDLATLAKKSRYRPQRVIAASKCQTCVFNSGGRCTKLSMKISNTSSVIPEDVPHLAQVISETVPAQAVLAVTAKAEAKGATPEQLFSRLIALKQLHEKRPEGVRSAELSVFEAETVDLLGTLKDAAIEDMFYVGNLVKVGENVDIHEYELREAGTTEFIEAGVKEQRPDVKDLEIEATALPSLFDSLGTEFDSNIKQIMSKGRTSDLADIEL